MPNPIGHAVNIPLGNEWAVNGADRPHGTEPTDTASVNASIRLMTGKELVEQMGRPPKHNIVLFGRVFKTNSAEYKEALTNLKDYQNSLFQHSNLPMGQFEDVKRSLASKLLKIITAADAYVTKHEGDGAKVGRSDVMTKLRAMAFNELQQLESIGLESFGGEQELNLSQAVALKRAGIGSNSDFEATLNDHSLNHGLSRDNFGNGNINTVSKLVFDVDGKQETRIVKPLVNERELVAEEGPIGMDKDNLQIAARNKATEITADALGLGSLAPKTDVIIHEGQAMLAMTEAPGEEMLGTVETVYTGADAQRMQEQYGHSDAESLRIARISRRENGDWVKREDGARDIAVANGENLALEASIQEQLLDLQLLDCLCGQVDRHQHNVYIRIDGATAQVTGIDNDIAFGKDTNIGSAHDFFYGPPPLMSQKSYEALMRLDPEAYGDSLPQGLSEEERTAAKGRLIELKEHAEKLKNQGLVVEDFENGAVIDPKTQHPMSISEFLTQNDARNYVERAQFMYDVLWERGKIAPLDENKHGEI